MGLLDRVQARQAESKSSPTAPPQSPSRSAATPGQIAPYLSPDITSGAPRASTGHLTALQLSIKKTVHDTLLDLHAEAMNVDDAGATRSIASRTLDEYLRANQTPFSAADRVNLLDALMADILGFGPLEVLLADPDVSEIMVNSAQLVYIERNGVITESNVHFETNEKLLQVIDRIVSRIGRHVDESSPLCDARLPDGSRVNVIIPPLALNGPCMTIRKFSRTALQAEDLIKFGSASQDMVAYLDACVRSRLNILVSGGTGSGKTTLLNILSSFIPASERIVTAEDAAELQLQQRHVIRLESRPANVEGRGAVSIRDLVRNALRMRPDRIIVGECRGGEALDMLQAMNTGHDGSMSTLHANNPREALSRLETLVLMAGADLPSRAIREQMASAIHIIVQQQRIRGGSRRITSIAEILGYNPATGAIDTQEIFNFKNVGVTAEGKMVGYHTATGILSHNLEHFEEEGVALNQSLFQPAVLQAY